MAKDRIEAAPFRQAGSKRVFEDICEQIRHQLASGAIRPGDKLPAERELALHFKVGRPAVREAFRNLEHSGIISMGKGAKGGATIRQGNPDLLTQSLQDLMLLGGASLRSLAEARFLIQEITTRLACERAGESDFLALEENIGLIEHAADGRSRTETGMQFFKLIARATHNEVLEMLVDSLGEIIKVIVDRKGRVLRPELIAVRKGFVQALRKRDVDTALRHMTTYLNIVHGGLGVPALAPSGRAARRAGRSPAAMRARTA